MCGSRTLVIERRSVPPWLKVTSRTACLARVSPVGSQPHQAVEDGAALIENVEDRVAGLRSQPAHPVVPPLGEPVEPGEAKVSQVCYHQRPGRQIRHQGARSHLRILVGMRMQADSPPLLAPEVEHPCQLAREEPTGACRNPSQSGEPPRHGVQRTLVDTHHLLGERGQPLGDRPLQARCQHRADLAEEPLQGRRPRRLEPLIDRLVCHRKAGEEPQPPFREEPPDGQLGSKASQERRPAGPPTEPGRAARGGGPAPYAEGLAASPPNTGGGTPLCPQWDLADNQRAWQTSPHRASRRVVLCLYYSQSTTPRANRALA